MYTEKLLIIYAELGNLGLGALDLVTGHMHTKCTNNGLVILTKHIGTGDGATLHPISICNIMHVHC